MPRQARKQSNSGYLHVIVRGNGKQILFEEDEDYAKYLRLLKKYSADAGISVCAYCLLDNHAHMLLKDTENEVSLMMKKIGVAYAQFFNAKYNTLASCIPLPCYQKDTILLFCNRTYTHPGGRGVTDL